MRREVARAIAVLSLIAVVVARPAPVRADAIDDNIDELATGSIKVRITAAAALAKASDDRAVKALARALRKDKDGKVRNAAALALKRSVTQRTGKAARTAALDALKAASKDKDSKVKAAAKEALAELQAILSTKAPKVFVKVERAKDKSKKAKAATPELEKAVKSEVARASRDFAVDWGGSLPTGRELEQLGTRAFVVDASVAKIQIRQANGRAEVTCSIEIRVAPWGGSDGEERWVANQMGKATGSGKATTGSTQRAIDGGIIDCVAAVGEQLTSDQIVPFIRRLASAK
jgi:hypothetical protein